MAREKKVVMLQADSEEGKQRNELLVELKKEAEEKNLEAEAA
jgi:hypothetical protein